MATLDIAIGSTRRASPQVIAITSDTAEVHNFGVNDESDASGDLKAIGAGVRRRRKDHGWSRQSQLADASGVNTETISKIENGKNSTTRSLAAVLRALNVTAAELLGRDLPRHTPSIAFADGTASARILKERSDRYRALASQVRDVVRTLVHVAAELDNEAEQIARDCKLSITDPQQTVWVASIDKDIAPLQTVDVRWSAFTAADQPMPNYLRDRSVIIYCDVVGLKQRLSAGLR